MALPPECTRKLAYALRWQAEQALMWQLQRRPWDVNLEVYRCRHCIQFHVGHQLGAARERARRAT